MHLIRNTIKYITDDYYSFLKQQNIVFACFGKPNTEKRSEFEKTIVMNENKKIIEAYNNLLKILNIKNKQFEQSVFNDFLEDKILGQNKVNHLILIGAMK